jgi:hypothetical protein
LGELPGFFHVGELCHVWRRAIVENGACGCGVRFHSCPVWKAIFAADLGPIDVDLARRMLAASAGMPKHRELFAHSLVPRAGCTARPGGGGADEADYVATLARLYSGIAGTGDRRVIVDSSKIPAYLYALGQIPDLSLRVVHLVRDPRATTYSWLRRIDRSDGGGPLTMERFPVWESSARWVTWNAMVPIVAKLVGAPVMRVHYEAFVANPRRTVRDIVSLVDEVAPVPESDLQFIAPHEVELHPNHTVWGNYSRQRTGRVPIDLDMEWTRAMSSWSRALVKGLTYPLARRYGYFAQEEPVSALPRTPPRAERESTNLGEARESATPRY